SRVADLGAVTLRGLAETRASHFHSVFAERKIDKMDCGCALRGQDGVKVQACGRDMNGSRSIERISVPVTDEDVQIKHWIIGEVEGRSASLWQDRLLTPKWKPQEN